MTGFRRIKGRVARLEQHRQSRSSYVVHLSTPPQAEELAAIEKAQAEGRRFAVLPHTRSADAKTLCCPNRPDVLRWATLAGGLNREYVRNEQKFGAKQQTLAMT